MHSFVSDVCVDLIPNRLQMDSGTHRQCLIAHLCVSVFVGFGELCVTVCLPLRISKWSGDPSWTLSHLTGGMLETLFSEADFKNTDMVLF